MNMAGALRDRLKRASGQTWMRPAEVGMPGRAANEAAASFGNDGFPLGMGRLDSSGAGSMNVAIPTSAALVGMTFYLAFITYLGPNTFGFSNDYEVTVQP